MRQLLNILIILIMLACNDDDHPAAVTIPELPAITQEGLNTAGFTIREMDGTTRNWVPYVKCGGFGTNPCAAVSFNYEPSINPEEYHSVLEFTLTRTTPATHRVFYLQIIDIEKEGDYSKKITQFDFRGGGHFYKERNDSNIQFNVSKLDEVNQIASGTFSGRLYNHDDEYIDIENGRFDFSFDACVCMD